MKHESFILPPFTRETCTYGSHKHSTGYQDKKDIYQGKTCHLCKGHFVTPSPHEDISRSFDSQYTEYEKQKNKTKKNERTKTNNVDKTKTSCTGITKHVHFKNWMNSLIMRIGRVRAIK